jgi:Protein of unknown function (DUF3309)
MTLSAVMAGLVPAIHAFDPTCERRGLPATSAGVTSQSLRSLYYFGVAANFREMNMLGTILLIILILLLLGALPTWPYSSRWGYYPSGGLGLVLVIVLILVLLGGI